MGYHKRTIKKGSYGYFSKVQEEWDELQDALEQEDRILELVELTDLIGAIEGYTLKKFNINLDDLVKFAKKTQSAFESGERS